MRETNNVIITGEVVSESKLSNLSSEKEKLYEFSVKVNRLSPGKSDTILVLVPENLVDLKLGNFVSVEGELKSHDVLNESNIRVRRILYVFPEKVEILSEQEGEDINVVNLIGFVCKNPHYKVTPNRERRICELVLKIKINSVKADYIPIILWGRGARYARDNIKTGDKIKAKGRVQKRTFYQIAPDSNERVFTEKCEISVMDFKKL